MTQLPYLLPLAMLIALLVDRLFGEPPTWAHPVVGMGRYLSLCSDRLLALPPAAAFAAGALAWCLGAIGVGLLAALLESWLIAQLQPWRSPLALLACAAAMGLLLKPLLAWSMLSREVAAVEAALQRSLPEGRARLARLVSRDTLALSASEVREAALETLAENLNDSVIAPLFWYVIAGLPGAVIYRFANTADAMWGYRGRWEWAGKWAARADDALSWLPARITALTMLGRHWRLLPALAREAAGTPSPNSGWPMAALALRLGLRLAKPDVYALNASGATPVAADMVRGQDLALRAMLLATLLLMLGAAALRGGFH